MAKIKGNRNIFIVIGIILGFILISFIYFSPQLQGKHLEAGDVNNFKGGAEELIDFRESTGSEALWTNSMFGGMPGYLISVKYTGRYNIQSKNCIKYDIKTCRLFSPNLQFLFCIAFNSWH